MRQEEWDLLLRAQPPVYRRVLVLYRQGLDAAAIAQEMNVQVRTINRILAKVRERAPRRSGSG
jgi:DNA-directed RNA polymerase specialized sigma24 family protein